MKLGFFILAVVFSLSMTYAQTGRRKLQELNSICNDSQFANQKSNYVLNFSGEKSIIGQGLGFLNNTLLLGTHLIVNRASSTFSNPKLMKAKDIGKISESSIYNFEVTDPDTSEAFFNSSKSLPLGQSLECSNRLTLKSYSAFSQGFLERNLVTTLEGQGCFKTGRPFVVSDQKVFDCNSFFNQSRVISFYSDNGNASTRVLTISLSEFTDRPNFIVRKVMEREIKRTLKVVPGIIESLKN